MLRKFNLHISNETHSLTPEAYLEKFSSIYRFNIKDQDVKADRLLQSANKNPTTIRVGIVTSELVNISLVKEFSLSNFNFTFDHTTQDTVHPSAPNLYYYAFRPKIAVICVNSQQDFDSIYPGLKMIDGLQNDSIINILLVPKGVHVEANMCIQGVISAELPFQINTHDISDLAEAIIDVLKAGQKRLKLSTEMDSNTDEISEITLQPRYR